MGAQYRSYSKVTHKLALGAVIAAGLTTLAGSAMAHAFPIPTNPTELDTDKLSVAVEGVIRPRCALGRGGTVNMGDLNRAATANVQIGLTCNLPFVLRLDAVNGAMVHSQMPNGQGDYLGHVPYGVDISVPLLRPSPTSMGGQYSSGQLRSGVTLDSAKAIAAGGATIRFSTPGSNNDLLAGEYSETITLTIQAKI